MEEKTQTLGSTQTQAPDVVLSREELKYSIIACCFKLFYLNLRSITVDTFSSISE